MLKTGAVIAGQLLEFQQAAQRNRAKANRTKVERGIIPTTVLGTAPQTGFETDRLTKTALENNGLRSTCE
jgi:hypothetical protein